MDSAHDTGDDGVRSVDNAQSLGDIRSFGGTRPFGNTRSNRVREEAAHDARSDGVCMGLGAIVRTANGQGTRYR